MLALLRLGVLLRRLGAGAGADEIQISFIIISNHCHLCHIHM